MSLLAMRTMSLCVCVCVWSGNCLGFPVTTNQVGFSLRPSQQQLPCAPAQPHRGDLSSDKGKNKWCRRLQRHRGNFADDKKKRKEENSSFLH